MSKNSFSERSYFYCRFTSSIKTFNSSFLKADQLLIVEQCLHSMHTSMAGKLWELAYQLLFLSICPIRKTYECQGGGWGGEVGVRGGAGVKEK